jgi:hypothetical protein
MPVIFVIDGDYALAQIDCKTENIPVYYRKNRL